MISVELVFKMLKNKETNIEEYVEEIMKLSSWKAAQYTDLPAKILKENSDIFGNYICDFFNDCVDKRFSVNFKNCKYYTSFYKRRSRFER